MAMKNQSPSRKRGARHYFSRYLAVALLIIGIVTAALNATFGGFTPVMWFLLAIAILIIITCREVLRAADLLESKK
jgi:NADH:ubiquinone oxidoreductase subunit 6 (subunit J)